MAKLTRLAVTADDKITQFTEQLTEAGIPQNGVSRVTDPLTGITTTFIDFDGTGATDAQRAQAAALDAAFDWTVLPPLTARQVRLSVDEFLMNPTWTQQKFKAEIVDVVSTLCALVPDGRRFLEKLNIPITTTI